jgi:hypothetical protein
VQVEAKNAESLKDGIKKILNLEDVKNNLFKKALKKQRKIIK